MVSAANDTWELERQIVETLISRLEEVPSTITYGDLAAKLTRNYEGREDAKAWRFFDTPLGRIQDSCADLGLPSLPVMVVRKNGMKPGIGYAAHYRKAHPETAGMSDSEIGAAQWEAVKHCKDWQALLDYYRIVKKFAGVKDPAAELKAKESYEEGRRISECILRA